MSEFPCSVLTSGEVQAEAEGAVEALAGQVEGLADRVDSLLPSSPRSAGGPTRCCGPPVDKLPAAGRVRSSLALSSLQSAGGPRAGLARHQLRWLPRSREASVDLGVEEPGGHHREAGDPGVRPESLAGLRGSWVAAESLAEPAGLADSWVGQVGLTDS